MSKDEGKNPQTEKRIDNKSGDMGRDRQKDDRSHAAQEKSPERPAGRP